MFATDQVYFCCLDLLDLGGEGGWGLGVWFLLLEAVAEVGGFVVDLSEGFCLVLKVFHISTLLAKQGELFISQQPSTVQPNPIAFLRLYRLHTLNHQPHNANIHLLLPILNDDQPRISEENPTANPLLILDKNKIVIARFNFLAVHGLELGLILYG